MYYDEENPKDRHWFFQHLVDGIKEIEQGLCFGLLSFFIMAFLAVVFTLGALCERHISITSSNQAQNTAKLQEAIAELTSWRQKYQEYSDLTPVFDSIDSINLNRVGDRENKK